MPRFEDFLDREPRTTGDDWWAANDPEIVQLPPGPGTPVEQGGIAGTGNTVGGGKFAGMNPQAAWETAKNELGYTGNTPQDQTTLQRIAEYLAANGAPGFRATGADTIEIPGGQTVDVLTAGNAWWWGPEGASGGGGAMPGNWTTPYGGFNTPPPTYSSQPWSGGDWTPPPLPAQLQTPYQAPTWGDKFTAPTLEQARNEPGYQFTLGQGQQAIERSAAAKGSILNPGTLKALDRYSQGLADTTYSNVYGRAFNEYQQKYGEFLGGAQLGLQGRQQNQSEYLNQAGLSQQAFGNRYNIYQGEQARTLNDWLQNLGAQRNARNDYWQQLAGLYGGGLQAALGTKTNTPVTSG